MDQAVARAVWPRVAFAFAFRYACFAAMLWMGLWAEARPAPSLPDALLPYVPYVPEVDRYNYLIWLLAYVPVGVALLWTRPLRFCRYMISAGLVALLRGLCIMATGLGPVRGADVNAGMDLAARLQAFFQLLTPVSLFGQGPAHVYLTKDLFFSGHTATTFLLLLYVWPSPRLRAAMLAGHAAVVAAVFLSHLHYTIDVIGAYAVVLSVFALREWPVRALLADPAGGATSAPPASS